MRSACKTAELPPARAAIGRRHSRLQHACAASRFLETAGTNAGSSLHAGTLFTTVGLAVALLTHGAPHFPEKAQRPLSFAVIVVAGLAYFKVKDLYVWKTGAFHLCFDSAHSTLHSNVLLLLLPLKTTNKVVQSIARFVFAGYVSRWYI